MDAFRPTILINDKYYHFAFADSVINLYYSSSLACTDLRRGDVKAIHAMLLIKAV